jgi:hypothetical protein
MSEHAPWCWICQAHHEPVNLSARVESAGFAGLLEEIRRYIRETPVSRRRSAMRTKYRRRTRTRTRSRR